MPFSAWGPTQSPTAEGNTTSETWVISSQPEQCLGLVNACDALVLVHDLKGHLLYANPAAAKKLDYELARLLNLTMAELLGDKQCADFDGHLQRVQKNGEDRAVLSLLTSAGERVRWQCHSVLVPGNPSVPIVRTRAHDVTREQRIETDLRASERRFRMFYEKAPVGICLAETETGHLISANPAFCEIVGRSEVELKGMDVRTISHPDDIAASSAKLHALASGEIDRFEIDKRLLRPDGTVRTVHVQVVKTSLEGETAPCNMATVEDITEHKLAEDALRASEAHFRMLIEQASDGIFIADSCGRYVEVNSAGASMLGYSRAEVLQRDIRDVVLPEQVSRVQPELARLADGETVRTEWLFLRKDGTSFFGEVVGRRLPDGRVQAVVRDLTERRRSEKALLRSEERYRSLIQASAQIVWTALAGESHRGDPLSVDWQMFTGQTGEETMGPGWLEAIHPDDRERTVEAWAHAIETESEYQLEHRVRRKDGIYRDMLARAVPVRDTDGKVLEWVGMHTDITERKDAERELQRNRDRLAGENRYLEAEISASSGSGFIGQSKAFKQALEQVARVCDGFAVG